MVSASINASPVPEREGVKFQDKVYRLSLEMVYIC